MRNEGFVRGCDGGDRDGWETRREAEASENQPRRPAATGRLPSARPYAHVPPAFSGLPQIRHSHRSQAYLDSTQGLTASFQCTSPCNPTLDSSQTLASGEVGETNCPRR